MIDREKVINGLESCVISKTKCFFNKNEMCPYASVDVLHCEQELMRDALALLKEQDEREKAICKEICDFIRHGCSTDTDDDKDYVCHVIQQCFVHFGRSVKYRWDA